MKDYNEFIESELSESANNREKELIKNAKKMASNTADQLFQMTMDIYYDEYGQKTNDDKEDKIVMKEVIKELNKKTK